MLLRILQKLLGHKVTMLPDYKEYTECLFAKPYAIWIYTSSGVRFWNPKQTTDINDYGTIVHEWYTRVYIYILSNHKLHIHYKNDRCFAEVLPWMSGFISWSKIHLIFFPKNLNQQWISIGSDNGLVSGSRQAITGIDDDRFYTTSAESQSRSQSGVKLVIK